MLSCTTFLVVDAADADIDCPGPGEPFVTSCSGSGSNPSDEDSNNEHLDAEEDMMFDDSDLVDEVIDDSEWEFRSEGASTKSDDFVDNKQQQQKQDSNNFEEPFVTSCSGSGSNPSDEDSNNEHLDAEEDMMFDDSDLVDEVIDDSEWEFRSEGASTKSDDFVDNKQQQQKQDSNNFEESADSENSAAIQQLKHTTNKLIQKYYDPLPKQGKCAIGTICGFTASRLTLGVANRIVRLAGATWVLSEVLHSSGFCDEAKCVPEEARPWVGIVRNALIKQCIKVRLIARKIWDQERIRELAQKDKMAAGGFAAGAFIGFVV